MKTAARVRGSVTLAGILAAAALIGGTSLTNAAWVDDEYVHANVGTDGTCSADSGIATIAAARQLTGTLLGSDLDILASLQGVQVSNDGAGTSTPSTGATRIDDNTFMAPLDLNLLAAGVLELSLPLGLPIGAADVYSQWGQTLDNGNTTAASGLITNSGGAISLGQPQDPSNPPVMATIDLGDVAPASLAGMTMDIGATSGIAGLTLCGDLGNDWLGPLDQPLTNREYNITSLALNAELPALNSAVTGIDQLLDGVQSTLDGVHGELESHMAAGLAEAGAPLLGALSIGDIDVHVTMTPVDLAPVRALLTRTLTDDRGLLTVDLGTGTVRVDLAKTVGGAYGLNNLNPNTQIVLNDAMVTELSTALAQVLDDWQDQVISAVLSAIRDVSVTIDATVEVVKGGVLVAEIDLGMGPVAVGNLLDLHNSVPDMAAVTVTSEVTILAADPLGLIAAEVAILASPGLTDALPGIAGDAFDDVVIAEALHEFSDSATALLSPAADSLTATLQQLGSVLSILVNVQPDQPGHPDPAGANPFSVSALRLAIVDDLNSLDLLLGTASVAFTP